MAVQRYSASNPNNKPLGKDKLFTVRQFQCHDGTDTVLINDDLIVVLENLKKVLDYMHRGNHKISIYSGYRTNSHSKAVGGYAGDQHTLGNAADICVYGCSSYDICRALQAMGHNHGIGLIDSTNVHVDVRDYWCWFDETNGEATVYSWFDRCGYGNYTSTKINAIQEMIKNNTNAIVENTKNPLNSNAITVTNVKFDNSKRVNRTEKTSKTENRHLGIDVSGWNHPMDWKKIKEFGVEFAILKIACVGNSYDWDAESLYSDSTVDECIKNEIPFGVYIYSYCSDRNQMASACTTIREKLKALKERAGQWFALPCYLDVEEMWVFNTGISNVHAVNKAFLKGIQDQSIPIKDNPDWHCPAGIYTTASGWADSLYDYIGTEETDGFAYKNYSIWDANPYNYRSSVNFPIDIWQYSFTGRIPGNRCDFDFDYGYFDLNIEKSLVNVSASSSGSAIKQRTAEDIYNEILRADFDSSGDVSAADARLILKKSAKLLPKESDEIFKTYNKLIEWKLAIPQGQDELKNNFQFLDKTFNAVQENYIRKSFVDFYGDKDNLDLEIPINDYENEFSKYKHSINTQFRYNKLTGDLNLDGIVSQKDVDLALQMVCGETTFDSALMIFPKASSLINCYAIYKNAQGEKLDDEQGYYDWQENIFKPYFYEKVIKDGLRDAVMRVAQNDYRLIDDNAINEIWNTFLNWVYSQYNSLRIFYRGIEGIDAKQVINMDIAKYLPSVLGTDDITDCLSILFHVLGISTLSIEDFKKFNYAIDRELNLYDAYVNYLCICVYVQSIQEHLVELFNKNGEEVENFIDENSEKLFDYWFVPTANDVAYDEKGKAHGANPFIAFRDIVRAVFSLAPDKDYAQAVYESFFGEPWSEKFFGTIDCPIGNGIHETFSYILKSETNEVEFFLSEWQKEDKEGIINSKILDYYKSFPNGEMIIKEKNTETDELEDRSINAYTIKRKTLFTKLIPNEFTKEEEGNDYKIFKLDDDWYMFNLNGFYEDNKDIIPIGQHYRVFNYADEKTYYWHYKKTNDSEIVTSKNYYEEKTIEISGQNYIIGLNKVNNPDVSVIKSYYEFTSSYNQINNINENSFYALLSNNIDVYRYEQALPSNKNLSQEQVDTATKKMNFHGKTEEESIKLVNNIYYPNLYNVYVAEYTYPNSDKPAPVGQFFSTPVTYERLKWSLFITLLAQAVKYCATKLGDALNTKSLWSGAKSEDPNKKISQELIEGSEAEMIDYFFGTKFKDLPTKEEVISDPDKYSNNDETLEDHISTLFRSVYHDDPNPTHHYNFYTVQNNKVADLGSYYPIDHAEEAFYYKDKNGKYTNLNFNDTISSLNNEITLPNTNIVLNADHSLKKILHENLMVFEKIMDWDFWKQPIPMTDLMDEETVKNIIKKNEELKNQEWMPQRNKFFRTDINTPGFTITKEGDLEIVDHNQAIFFLKMLSLMYPGIMKYRKDDFNYDTGWVKGLIENPEKLVFWIDFLDDVGEISKYSVKNIGQRQKVVTQDNVRAIKYLDTEKTVFIEPGLPTKENTKQAKFAATHQGYSYFQLGRRFMEQLALSGQGIDAYTVIENMLYNYAQCAESVTMSTIPLYFLEPNSRLQVYNPDTDVNSTYVLSKLSIPLGHSGTMSLTMTKALEDNVVRGEITKV